MLHILAPITPPQEGLQLSNLGHLFNGYQSRLSRLMLCATPCQTLREYRELATRPLAELTPEQRDSARAIQLAKGRLYELAVLTESLNQLHVCVMGACEALAEFFTDFNGDLHHYAIENRLRRISESVPGDDAEMAELEATQPEEYAKFADEWEPTPEARPGDPTHRVKYKADEASLTPYTLLAELGMYFEPLRDETNRLETIGNSTPLDFANFTELVRTYSEANKTSHLADLGVYRPNAAGEWERMSYADRVEVEVNAKLKDERIASHFDETLFRLLHASAVAACLTDAASYRELWAQLVAIRDCTGLTEPGAEPTSTL